MKDDTKTLWVWGLLTVVFSALAVLFARVPARSSRISLPPLFAPSSLAGVTPTGTIRISAGQLIRSGGDASGLACYACHEKDKPPEIKYDADGQIVLPKEHLDLILSMRNCAECHSADHPEKLEYRDDGSVIVPKAHESLTRMGHARNNNCYNCHDRDQLDQLHSASGEKLKFEQATLLCAGCHGPTYRDWLAGAHGRTGGYWDTKLGERTRQECTSCHDPHSPRFTPLIPMPGPHLLHPAPFKPDSHAP